MTLKKKNLIKQVKNFIVKNNFLLYLVFYYYEIQVIKGFFNILKSRLK